MNIEDLKIAAEEIGFEHFGEVNMNALIFQPEVRDMCAANKCAHYGRSWTCPPGCGTLEEMAEKVKKFSTGLLVQTTVELEDSFDFEAMAEGAQTQKERFNALADRLHASETRCMLMGAGESCENCAECTYPDAPCRFPDKAQPSMEACGLNVSQVCGASGVKYYYGPGTLTYTCCVLI